MPSAVSFERECRARADGGQLLADGHSGEIGNQAMVPRDHRWAVVTTLRTRAALLAVAAAAAMTAAACRSSRPVGPTVVPPTGTVRVMGVSRLSGAQLVAWFNGRQPRFAGVYRATVAVETLADHYVREGAAEGVTGDVAFVQGIVETGWFRFEGSVHPSTNNFAGIGASGAQASPSAFPDARTGVRAQIQHLRAYADPGAYACTVPPLHNPCVDPRFDLVVPKGKAPTWNQLGSGNWAASPTYATSILGLYDEALRFSSLR